MTFCSKSIRALTFENGWELAKDAMQREVIALQDELSALKAEGQRDWELERARERGGAVASIKEQVDKELARLEAVATADKRGAEGGKGAAAAAGNSLEKKWAGVADLLSWSQDDKAKTVNARETAGVTDRQQAGGGGGGG